jgi:signal transduction histidine kinase
VEEQARRLSSPGLDIVVEARGNLGGLPAAVEVAAYRIVSEALANTVRPAPADHCAVLLARRQGALEVTVRDDGVGIARDISAGVGMLSLRERAAELGGTSTVECPAGGGTLVRAVLPSGTVGGVDVDEEASIDG